LRKHATDNRNEISARADQWRGIIGSDPADCTHRKFQNTARVR
jgi:hypothetical protein